MKEIRTSFFALIMLLLASCSSNRMNKDEHFYGLNTMLDYYYYHYCDYPSSIKELEDFANLNLYDSSFVDTANVTIYNLKKNEKAIVWQLNDSFPINQLLITKGEETLAYRVNDNRFPSLDNFIESYIDCYGVFPYTINGFIAFRKTALDVTKHLQFWEYDSLTVHNLQKCQDLDILTLSVAENYFILKVYDDTIAYWSCRNQQNGFCYQTPERVYFFSPRFFDSDGVYAFCDDSLYDVFRNNIRDLYYNNLNGSNDRLEHWTFIQYTRDRGFEFLCKDVDLSTNDAWDKIVFDYVSSFAEKHNFSKIIFACPSFE